MKKEISIALFSSHSKPRKLHELGYILSDISTAMSGKEIRPDMI
jgi:hypothetical protein